MELYTFRAMNTDILMAAEGEPADLADAFWTARLFVDACERRFTRFSADSELSALNRSGGSWFAASPQMMELVLLAIECYEAAGGLFDPSILPELQRAGYTVSMEVLRKEGAGESAPTHARCERVPFSDVEIRPEQGLIRLPPGMALDLGGIAKGWIAEKAASLLGGYSPACAVDAGGDMFFHGLPEDTLSWTVEIEDPRDSLATLTRLEVGPGALATSSVVKRSWNQGGERRHHLIDPRTGEPAATDWLSLTVFAQHAHLAEVFAKALLIAGPAEAEQIARANPGLRYLAVGEGGIVAKEIGELEVCYAC